MQLPFLSTRFGQSMPSCWLKHCLKSGYAGHLYHHYFANVSAPRLVGTLPEEERNGFAVIAKGTTFQQTKTGTGVERKPLRATQWISGKILGVPKPGCLKSVCLQFLHRSGLLRSFTPFCALFKSFALFCGLAFALFCARLRSFARICVFLRTTAFRTTAFGNSRNISQYDPFSNRI